MHTVSNLFALLLGTIIEEKHMLISVVGSAVFKMHVFFLLVKRFFYLPDFQMRFAHTGRLNKI